MLCILHVALPGWLQTRRGINPMLGDLGASVPGPTHLSPFDSWQPKALSPHRIFFFFLRLGFSNCPKSCRILVPWPGIELNSPVLEGRFLATGVLGQSPQQCLMQKLQPFGAQAQCFLVVPVSVRALELQETAHVAHDA